MTRKCTSPYAMNRNCGWPCYPKLRSSAYGLAFSTTLCRRHDGRGSKIRLVSQQAPLRPYSTAYANFSSHDPFPFLRLPGELRNKIYRYVYGADEIIIRTIRPERYKPGCSRTEYEVMSERKIRGKRVLQRTTYEIVAPHPYRAYYTKPFPRSLFFVNRQIQREVAPFIYRKQHHFKDVQAIVPYLQDQPQWARAMIKFIHLLPREFYPCNPLNRTWRKACWWIKKNLKLHALSIFLAPRFECTEQVEAWDFVSIQEYLDEEEWVTHLVAITGLKRVFVFMEESWDDSRIEKVMNDFEKKLNDTMVRGKPFTRRSAAWRQLLNPSIGGSGKLVLPDGIVGWSLAAAFSLAFSKTARACLRWWTDGCSFVVAEGCSSWEPVNKISFPWVLSYFTCTF